MSTINWTPIIAPLLSVTGIIMIGILLTFCGIRRLHRAWTLYKFPNRKIPLPKVSFGKTKLFERINSETETNVNYKYYPNIPPPPGWEFIGNQLVNYKKFIAKTPFILETAILNFNSTLQKYHNQTFDEYYRFIKNDIPSLEKEWNTVIKLYERAEYDSSEISKQDYEEFRQDIYTILVSLENKL